ncbi:MAG TPA: hypothetical protein VFE98_02390 [Candidatus Bathyarchaeia archaeon]|nr:hypothetical protein [Candidatus Bathyarchaeia archaeon]
MVAKLFDRLTDEEARTLGREAANNTGTEVINFYSRNTTMTLMKTVQILGQYGRMYTFETSFDGKRQATRPQSWTWPKNFFAPA